MIFRNNAANRRLAETLREVVEREPGFRARVDKSWNCRKDIRFEIGVTGINAPFIVMTDYLGDGRMECKVRFMAVVASADDFSDLRDRFDRLDGILYEINERIEAAKPAPSAFGKV